MFLLPTLIVALSLDVPYLPQSEALCGGAAAAMVFRYWGDTHAGVEQFAPLVDRRAGGIANDVLENAITQRGWRALRIKGSVDALREQIGWNRPVIILVDERARADTQVRPYTGRPARYHYLVVTGVESDAVLVHDPSWGPSRRLAAGDLIRAWRAANFWALVVLPSEARETRPSAAPDPAPITVRSPCEARLDEAVARVRERGFDAADEAFGGVSSQCPGAAGPLRELAGVRFAQRRWGDAADLAAQALARDAHDSYAWDVLASSRFVQDDLPGALRAWNQIGKPRVDLVNIAGLQHARYELIADALGLAPNGMLTADAFGRAARRLNELPDRQAARIAYRPAGDGFATVDVMIDERERLPHGAAGWTAASARSLVDREVEVALPGFTGQGELWSASGRWWSGRPRLAGSLATPHVGSLPGIWRVDGSWESQRYASGDTPGVFTETRAHGGLSMSDWLSGAVRYELSTGLDAWNGARRTASIGAAVERRFAEDRVAIATGAASFVPLSAGSAFHSADLRLEAKTSTAAAGWVLVTRAGAQAVTAAAPLALWPGAGDGHGRPVLLRAHPLLEGGAITGPAFGRTLLHAGTEVQRWLDRASPLRAGIAGFADLARATRRLPSTTGAAMQVDVGVGVRVKVPGAAGTLRADAARGLRDGATAFTIGWQY